MAGRRRGTGADGSAASAGSASGAGMGAGESGRLAGMVMVTIPAPQLASRDLHKLGILRFLQDWEVYLASLPTGATPQPLMHQVPREAVDYWVRKELIKGRGDTEIADYLRKLSGKAVVAQRFTLEEVFEDSEKVAGLYQPNFEPHARIRHLLMGVDRILVDYGLEEFTKTERGKRKLQKSIAELVRIPKGPERIKRRMKLEGGAMADELFEATLLSLCLQHEEFKVVSTDAKERGKKEKEVRRVGSKEEPKVMRTEGKGASMAHSAAKDGEKRNKKGELIKCYTCGGNHFADRCTSKVKGAATDRKAREIRRVQGKGDARQESKDEHKIGKAASREEEESVEDSDGDGEGRVNAISGSAEKEILDAFVGEVPVKVLCDSGSDMDLIPVRTMEGLGISRKEVEGKGTGFAQADGETPLETFGEISLGITFATGTITLRLTPFHSKFPEIVLGRVTLRKYGARIKESLLEGIALSAGERGVAVIRAKGEDEQDGAEGGANDEMEKLLVSPPKDATTIPPVEVLFPALFTLSLLEAEKVRSFHARLPELLYLGAEPLLGPDLTITLKEGATPFYCQSRSFTPMQRKVLEETIAEYLKHGWIIPQEQPSLWASIMFVVRKADGGWRPVADYTGLNARIVVPNFPMPAVGADEDLLADAVYFSKLDAEKGYHQVRLDPSAAEVLTLLIADRLFRPTRLFPGVASATAHFQSVMQQAVLGDIPSIHQEDRRHLRVWLDDVRQDAKDLNTALERLERLLQRLKARRVRLNLKKCVLLATEIVYCGKLYSAGGIKHDPERVRALLQVPTPNNGADLSWFLHSVQWNAQGIPRFEEVASPLRVLLEKVYVLAGGRTTARARRVKLQDLWQEQHQGAFEMLKSRLANETQRDFPRQDWELFLFTDASAVFWAGCLMQAPKQKEGEDGAALNQRPMRLLGFASGSFRGSSLNWDTQSKEFYSVLASLERLKYLIIHKVILCFDHANFKWILGSENAAPSKASQARIIRMRETLGEIPHDLKWVRGATIPYVDYFTRSGAAVEAGMVGAIRLLASSSDEDFDWPKKEEFVTEEGEPGYARADDGIWRSKSGKIWVPPIGSLRMRIFIAVHSGRGGHPGAGATEQLISQQFTWETLKEDTKAFVAGCVHCQANRDGSSVPRALGEVVLGTTPFEVVQVDHLHMEHKGEGYLLVITDTFSGFTMLRAVATTGAEDVCRELVDFASTFRIPAMLVTDRGSAFTSEMARKLAGRLGVEQHLVVAGTHTGLGIVERKNREILGIFRRLLSERRRDPAEWKQLLPVVQAAINAIPRERLNGRSAAEVALGLVQKEVINLMEKSFRVGKLQDAENILMQEVESYVQAREKWFGEASEEIERMRQRRRKANEKQRGGSEFIPGEFVMVARAGQTGKLEPTWTGPFIFLKLEGHHVEVKDAVTGAKQRIHVSRVRNFQNSLLFTSAEVREQAGYLRGGFKVQEVVDHGPAEDGAMLVNVKWQGFEDSDNTWEPLEAITAAAPKIVQAYVRGAKDKSLTAAFRGVRQAEGVV